MKSYGLLKFILSVIEFNGFSGEKDLEAYVNISPEEIKMHITQLIRLGKLNQQLIEQARMTGETVQPIIADIAA